MAVAGRGSLPPSVVSSARRRPRLLAGMIGAGIAGVITVGSLFAGDRTVVLTWWVPVTDSLTIALFLTVAALAASDAQLRRDGGALPVAGAAMAIAALWVPHLLTFPGVLPGSLSQSSQESGFAYSTAHIATAVLLALVMVIVMGPLRRPLRATAAVLGGGLLLGAALGVSALMAAPHLPPIVSGLRFTSFNQVLLGVALVPMALLVGFYVFGRRADPRTSSATAAAIGILSVDAVLGFATASRDTPLWFASTLLRPLAPLALVAGQILLYRATVRGDIRRHREAALFDDITARLSRTLDLGEVLVALDQAAPAIAFPEGTRAHRARVVRVEEGWCRAALHPGSSATIPDDSFPLSDHPFIAEVMATGIAVTAAVDLDSLGPRARAVVSGLRSTHGAWARLAPDGVPWGVIAAATDAEEGFDASILDRLSTLASVADLAIANALAHQSVAIRDRLHQTMLDTLTEGIIVVTRAGVTSANPAAAEILGVERDQLTRREAPGPSWETVALDGSPWPAETRPSMVTLLTGVPQRQRVMGVRRSNGNVRWLSVSAIPLLEMEVWDPDRAAVVVSFTDVTDLLAAEASAREEERRYRLLANNSTDVISRLTPDGAYLYASPSLYALLGYAPEELVGHDVLTLIHPDDVDAVAATHSTVGERTATMTYRMRRADGSFVWVEPTSHGIRDSRTQAVLEIQSSTRDVTARQGAYEKLSASNARLAELATTDALTGLANRRALEGAMASMSRGPFAILAIDVDNLKGVNDEHGHAAGDLLIQTIATTLAGTLRAADVLARVGGDELVAIVQDVAAAGAARATNRMQAALRRAGAGTVSIGCAAAPAGAQPHATWKAADSALYAAKRAGRNRVVFVVVDAAAVETFVAGKPATQDVLAG